MKLANLFHDPEVRAIVAREEKQAAERIACLTPRQRQILAVITDGQMNKQAAHDLGISHRTVENHRLALMEKTGARNFAELVRLSILAGD